MPQKYSALQKRDAMDLIDIHDDIPLVHQRTGVPERTLRRWRDELHARENYVVTEKDVNSDTKRSQSTDQQSDSDDPETAANPRQPTDSAESESEEQDNASTDFDDFSYIRDQLMKYARTMATNLHPGEPDSNRHTLALSRALDRIQWLDGILPDLMPKPRSHWQDAYDALLALDLDPADLYEAEQTANRVEEHLKARVYKYYAKRFGKNGKVTS